MNTFRSAIIVITLAACAAAQTADDTARSIALHEAGFERFTAGSPNEALTLYRQANELVPSAESYNNIGVTLGGLGRYKEAVDHFTEGIKLFPRSANLHRNLGFALAKLGDRNAAIPHYQTAIGLQPDYAAAYSDLGAILTDLGRPRQAVVLLKKAVALAPEDALVTSNLGWAYVVDKNLRDGRVALERAVKLDPELDEARFRLGIASSLAGDREAAIRQYGFLKDRRGPFGKDLFDFLHRGRIIATSPR